MRDTDETLFLCIKNNELKIDHACLRGYCLTTSPFTPDVCEESVAAAAREKEGAVLTVQGGLKAGVQWGGTGGTCEEGLLYCGRTLMGSFHGKSSIYPTIHPQILRLSLFPPFTSLNDQALISPPPSAPFPPFFHPRSLPKVCSRCLLVLSRLLHSSTPRGLRKQS